VAVPVYENLAVYVPVILDVNEPVILATTLVGRPMSGWRNGASFRFRFLKSPHFR